MKKLLVVLFSVVCVVSACCFALACKPDKTTNTSAEIENGGFESGNLDGWTKKGNAFQDCGVTSVSEIAGEEVGFSGSYYFNGLESGLQSFTGTLRSSEFRIDGTGSIAFLLGAGKSTSKCYVTVHLVDGDKEIAKQANDAFDGTFVTVQLIRYTLDLSAYAGKNAYIVVTDNDKSSDYGYVLCDDFVTYIKDLETLKVYKDEHDEKIKELVPEKTEEDPSRTYILNGDFETGDLSGWTILSGKTYGKDSVVPSSNRFWGTRDYLAQGDYFVDGYHNGEEPKGVMRSSLFTLSGDGWISFLMGGTSSKLSYVAVCDEEGKEVIKQTNSGRFKDPEMSLCLSRYYIDASEYAGKVLYIKVVDGQPSGPFGSLNVDDFRVSMTEAEVQTLEGEEYKAIMALPSNTANDYIKNFYRNFEYPFELPILRFSKTLSGKAMFQNAEFDLVSFVQSNILAEKPGASDITYGIGSVEFESKRYTEGFTSFDMSKTGVYKVGYFARSGEDIVTGEFLINVAKTGTILNGDFESGNLDGWTIVNDNAFDPDSAVQETVYDTQDECKTPYNKSGKYHFDGREAQRGFPEELGFTLRSNVFTLSGVGYISFKLGGRTATVHVYTKDGTKIARYTNTEFVDLGHPLIEKGARLSTMTTYVADLSDYVGKEIYIELVDETGGSWGQSWFDDIVVEYQEIPDLATAADTVDIYRALDEEGSGVGKWNISATAEKYLLPWKPAVNKIDE